MSATRKKILVAILISMAVSAALFAIPSKEPIYDPDAVYERRVHTKAELKAFVNSPHFRIESIKRYLAQDDVPVLIDMLNDNRYQKDWAHLTRTLGFLDEGTEAQHAIIYHIQRGRPWPWGDSARLKIVWMKIAAVVTLGRTNGEVAQATARDALTESGALKLAEEWIERDLPGQFKSNPERVIALIRGDAALGLVYSQDEESIQLVENLFESVAPRAIEQRKHQLENSIGFLDQTREEQALDTLHGGLVTALAARDLIDDIGYDRLLKMHDEEDALGGWIAEYSQEYLKDYP
ncbi:MAG: hypothetical protein IID08_03275 [Candidatus Hydrogenedentes bacterium]|nr:hypothetical protein [Candidatus Hydrogenedentota bacterium]